MNKIYKLKYDRCRSQVVVVSELTAGAGKEASGQVAAPGRLAGMTFSQLAGTLTPLAFLTALVMSFLPGIALANPDLPVGGQIVAGQGSISTSGNQMTINQNTHGMVTNWNSFDVGKNHAVQFVQPDSSAVALNRVTGGHESQIMGTLTANGQVMLVNPAGVMFGKGATVNTAGLVASTKNISNADFMAGHYTFNGGSNPDAEVVNQGNLTTTKGGYIVLAADRVKNSGTIRTPGGKTVLAAGEKVTLQLDNTGLASVSVNGDVVNALVENSGLLSATDGRVYLTARGKDMLLNTVVNNSGTVEASGLSGRGGDIVLNGGDSGVVGQSGTLLADSKAGRGGKITVEGENIHLDANSRTSATGRSGGGEVYVGGGWQGKDSRIHNARKVVMDKKAIIDVSATKSGDGGTAVLWSEDYTNFRGAVLAKGGVQSGNGGQVETSSYQDLQAFGDVDASAPAGRGGNWLLDPLDVTIVSGDTNTSVTESGKGTGAVSDTDTDHIFSPSASGAQISAQKIADQLNSDTDVTVDTHGDGSQQGNITLADNVTIQKTQGNSASLTLKADKDIQFGKAGKIVATKGKLNLNLLTGNSGQNGKVTLVFYPEISLNGGDFLVGPANSSGGNASMLFMNSGSINAGNITLNTGGGIAGNFYSLNATGNLTVTGPLSVIAGYKITSNIKAGHLLNITADSGDISFTATKVSDEGRGGKILIQGSDGVNIQAKNGHLVMNVADKTQNEIKVSSDKGSVFLGGKVQDGSNGLSLTKVNISSQDKTTLDGTTYWGLAAVLSGLNVTAGGDIDISGVARRLSDNTPGRASSSGVQMSGSSISSTGGNITVSGFAATDKVHPTISTLDISNSNITADSQTGKIVLNGTTETTTGLKVTGSNISAASLEVKGVATKQGTGFSLINSHLLNGLADLKNVTFSSAGSAAGVTNALDRSIVTDDNRDTLMEWHPENMTQIDMGGVSIFDDNSKTDKGWVADFTSDDTPNGGWIFNNTSVTAGDTVDLKGVGFTNSTIAISDGDFRLTNNGPLTLNNDTITVDKGGVDVHSLSGNISLVNSNLSAKNDINLNASHDGIKLWGSGSENAANIVSDSGNITINGNATGRGSVDGVYLKYISLSAPKGSINITGVTAGYTYFGTTYGISGVKFSGDVSLNSTLNTVSGTSVANPSNGKTSGVELYDNTSVGFTGDTIINAKSTGGTGLLFNGVYGKSVKMKFMDGKSVINAANNGVGDGSYLWGGIAIAPWAGSDRQVEFEVNNGSLDMTAEGKGDSFGGIEAINKGHRGFIFTGNGDVSITGIAEQRAGVELRALSNSGLTGSFTVTGKSINGAGVSATNGALVDVKNAVINGESTNGIGVEINASDETSKSVNLNGNTITGQSKSDSAGIKITGNNVSIANGTLSGASGGAGAGVLFSGGTNYTISGTTVTGSSVNGAGISAGGNLVVNNGAVLNGSATGSGSGVVISGNLKNTEGSNTEITGTANSGDGIKIAGDSSLANATLVGTSSTGTGVNVSNNLTVSGTSSIKGKSDKKTGVNIAQDLTVTPVLDEHGDIKSQASITGESGSDGVGVILGAGLDGGSITGISVSGTGVQLADNAKVTRADVSGQSTSGKGVSVTGNVSLDDKSAASLRATSVSGTGLSLENNTRLGIVQKGGQVPVTIPVVFTGASQTGSGVETSGNVSVSGVTLSGATDADGGTGVTLGGNLTFTDDISGISASATGNGTALKISDGVVDAKGYRDAGKTLVINPTSENGTAISTTGNSNLITVELRGTASGNGSAAVVNGTLSTDKALTVVSKGDKGVGLQLSGGHLQSTAADNTPVKVTVSATGNGTAVAVAQPESGQTGSSLSGIDLNASADKGTVMDIDGDLTTDRDISVSTEDGTAISLNGGSLQGAEGDHPVTVTAQATGSGTGLTVKPSAEGKPESSLANMTLNTVSAQGDALNVEGVVNTKDVVVVADSRGTGTALNVNGGEIHSQGGTNITAMSDIGHAAVINGGKLTGDLPGALTVTATTKTDHPALSISGTSDVSNSMVNGENSGNGSAVSVAGVVTSSGGGEIKGQTVNGTAVEIMDGTSATSSQEGGLLITATATGEQGTGVVLGNATLTGSQINADATQGNAVTITDGSITGGNIAGHALGGVGLNISNAVLSKVVASGTTQTGTGTVINGTITSDESSQITGTATQDGGNGVNVSGSVTGGKVEGHATSGDAVTVADGSSIADAEVKGDAGSGTGVSVAGKTTLTNASLSGATQTGKGTVIAGSVTADDSSVVSGKATQDGGNGVNVSGSVTGGKVEGHATSGDAVTVADGSSVADAEVKGDAGSGTGVSVAGKTTLTNASLSGTTQTGKGTVIAGSVTADDNSVVSGKVAQDGGEGVSVSGNITGGKVEGHATSGNAVNITGAVNHGVIFGEATQGTGVVVNTGSQVTDTAINGNTTEGTGAHWHAGVKHNHVTITGNATSGTGVQIDADTTLKNATVSGSTENGKGVNVAGALVNTGSTTLTGHSSGPGTGVDVAGNISGGSITGNATGTGAGVTVSGQDVKVSDVVVKGNTVNGTGMSVTGNLTGSDSATVTGLATGSGMGVDIGGKLTGTISGSSSSGTGIRVTDGADIVQGSHADGNSESGTGAVIQGSVTNQGSISGQSGSGGGTLIGGTVAGKGDITGTSKGAGEGVILAGNVTGGGIIGQSDGGAGLSISDDSTLTDVTASGLTVTGTGVHVKGNLVNKGGTTVMGAASGNGTGMLLSGSVTGGVINGHSTDGVGVSTDRNVTLTDVAVNGTSVSHSGVQVSSDVTNTGSTVITGSSESGAGVSLNGTVSGGALKGHSVSGPGLHVTGDSQVNSVEVSSSSEQGSEVQMDGNLSSADSSLNGQALQDTVTTDIIRQAAYQQQGVISHTARQKHPAMASGYKEQDKPVSVEICADGQCRKLDAGMLARPVRQ